MNNHIKNKSFVYIMYVYCVYLLCIYKYKHMHVTYLRKICTYLTFLLIRLKTNFLKLYRTGLSFILLIGYEWIMKSRLLLLDNISFPTHIYTYIYIYAFSRRFYPKTLTVHSSYKFSLVCVFPGNRTHNLLRCLRNALPLNHTGTHMVFVTPVGEKINIIKAEKCIQYFFSLKVGTYQKKYNL